MLQRRSSDTAHIVEPRPWHRRLVAILVVGDFVMLVLAAVIATQLRWGALDRFAVVGEAGTYVPYWGIAAAMMPVWLFLLWLAHLYDLDRVMWYGSDELSRVARVVSMGVVVLTFVTYALKLPGISRGWLLALWLFGIGLLWLERVSVWLLVRRARRQGRLPRYTLVVGSGEVVQTVARRLTTDTSNGVVTVGYVAPQGDHELHPIEGLPYLGTLEDMRTVVAAHGIDSVVVSTGAIGERAAAGLVADLRLQPIDTYLSAGLADVLTRRVLVREIGGIPLILVRGISLTGHRAFTKRAFDLSISLLIGLLLLPLWTVIAVSIKLDDGGPILFAQERTGVYGRSFRVFKFRTMELEAASRHTELAEDNEADGPIFKMREDPRVTRSGKWLRKFSLDEFPQLINVLRGEMSLVGPRPLPTYETTDLDEQQDRRHEVLPGITGMWQVSGRSDLSFDEMVRLDLFYIENWCLTLDMELLARTIPAVLGSRGAY